jgi:polyhydroxybutyrate depolymerase
MTNRMALELPDKIAAIAPIAGTFPKQLANRAAEKARAMPVCYFHGTADKLMGYDGKDGLTRRQFSMGAEDLVAFWVERDGCAKEPKVEKLPDIADDGTTVERRTYANGRDGAEVVFYRIEGGGHTWPGGFKQPERLLGKTCRNIDASRIMWDFFAKYSLPGK